MALKKRPTKKKVLGKKRVKKTASKPAPTTSILDRIKPVSELETNLNMLVYGRSGTGKTHFGSTFPRPSLFIDTNERGTETIAQEEGIDVVRVTEWQEIDELLWALKDGMEYESIIIDQVTAGHDGGIFNGPKFSRTWVDDPDYGVPFVGSSAMLMADLSNLPLLRRKDAESARLSYLRLSPGMTLISFSFKTLILVIQTSLE